MKNLRIITLYAATMLSACAVGPDFKRPDAPATTNYISKDEVLTNQQRIELGKQIEADWWTLFSSDELNSIISQSMADNNDIAAAKATLAQVQEAVKSETGGLFPQVSLDGTAGRQKYGVALFGPSNFAIPPFTYYEAGLSMSWTPDIFGGTRRAIEREKALAEYQSHQLDAAYVTLTGNVVAQTLNIAAAKAEISVTEQIIADDKKTLNLINKAFKAGSDTKVNVLSAQSQLDNDQALLPSLRQRLSVARHALSILMGKAPADWTPPDFELSNFTMPKELPVSLPSELVRKRPDILASEANLHAASAAVGVATANLYPKITLSANSMQEALTGADLFKAANNAWALAGGLTAPIFDGGRLTAEKHEAELAYQGALAQYKQVILTSFGQVADALQALTHTSQEIAAQKQAVNTTSSTLNLARKSYTAGNTGLLDIQNAQRQLSQARLGLIRAQSQHYLDVAQLFVALGGSPNSKE